MRRFRVFVMSWELMRLFREWGMGNGEFLLSCFIVFMEILAMNISLTSAQETFIQSKISAGKYKSTQEIFELAFLLLEEYERAENEWILLVKEKIQSAIDVSETEPPIDGETFVSGVLERFKGV